MSEPNAGQDLPVYRRADCGHGFLAGNARPSGIDPAGREIYMCQDCKRNLNRPIETKDTKATQQRIAGR